MLAKDMTPGSKAKDSLLLRAIIVRGSAVVLNPSLHRTYKRGQMIPAPVVGCTTERNAGLENSNILY